MKSQIKQTAHSRTSNYTRVPSRVEIHCTVFKHDQLNNLISAPLAGIGFPPYPSWQTETQKWTIELVLERDCLLRSDESISFLFNFKYLLVCVYEKPWQVEEHVHLFCFIRLSLTMVFFTISHTTSTSGADLNDPNCKEKQNRNKQTRMSGLLLLSS